MNPAAFLTGAVAPDRVVYDRRGGSRIDIDAAAVRRGVVRRHRVVCNHGVGVVAVYGAAVSYVA